MWHLVLRTRGHLIISCGVETHQLFLSCCFESLLGAEEEFHHSIRVRECGVLEPSDEGLVWAEGAGVRELALKSPECIWKSGAMTNPIDH